MEASIYIHMEEEGWRKEEGRRGNPRTSIFLQGTRGHAREDRIAVARLLEEDIERKVADAAARPPLWPSAAVAPRIAHKGGYMLSVRLHSALMDPFTARESDNGERRETPRRQGGKGFFVRDTNSAKMEHCWWRQPRER